jgi:hypothetical protein
MWSLAGLSENWRVPRHNRTCLQHCNTIDTLKMSAPQEGLNGVRCIGLQNASGSNFYDERRWDVSNQVFFAWCLNNYCGNRRDASLVIDTTSSSHLRAVVVELFVPMNAPGSLDSSRRLCTLPQRRGRLIRSKPAKESLRKQRKEGFSSEPSAMFVIVGHCMTDTTRTHLADIGRLMTKCDSFGGTKLSFVSASCSVSPHSALQLAQGPTDAAFRGHCDLSPRDTLN